MLDRRRPRRAHRRLPRRADHADPRPRPDEGPVARLRPHLRPPGRGLPRAGARAGREDRRQRRRPQPGRAGRAVPRGRAGGSAWTPAIAHVEGDDLLDRAATSTSALPARQAADRQRLPRRASASPPPSGPVPTWWSPAGSPTPRWWSGPAVARFGWAPTSYDELAGAPVAGHVLECGTQATGGNFSGSSTRRAGLARRSASRSPRSRADGSCVITKHPGTGGEVTVDTVTAQLVYEIQSPGYLGPDVTTHLDTVPLERRRARPGPDLRRPRLRPAGHAQGLRSTSSAASATPPSWCWSASTSTRRPPGCVPRSTPRCAARTAGRRRVVARPHRPRGRRHRGGRVLPAPGHRPRPGPAGGRQGVHRPAGRARARVLPGLHPHRPPAPATPYGVYRPAFVPPLRRRAARCTPVVRGRAGRRPSPTRHHRAGLVAVADACSVRAAAAEDAGPDPARAARAARARPVRRQGR